MRLARVFLAGCALTAGATLFATPNEAEDGSCTTATSAEVRELYRRYADALKRGDVEALTALYSPDAILMGPAAASIRLGHGEIAGYYSAFLSRRPTVAVVERVVRTECGGLGDAGVETLTLTAGGGAVSTVQMAARYSISYARFGEHWLIVHHRQDLPDTLPGADLLLTGDAPSPIVTGANPPQAQNMELPQAAYVLPASPPVILSPTRPLLPVIEPATPIDFAALNRLLALSPAAPRTAPIVVALPDVPLAFGAPAPDLDTVWVFESRPVLASTSPPASVDVALPPPAFAVPGAPPPVSPGNTTLPPPIERTANPVIPPADTSAAVKSAVAGFTQRLPTSAATPQTQAPQAARAAAVAKPALAQPSQAAPTKPASPRPAALPRAQIAPKAARAAPAAARPVKEPVKTGKFLRWDDGTPVFDD